MSEEQNHFSGDPNNQYHNQSDARQQLQIELHSLDEEAERLRIESENLAEQTEHIRKLEEQTQLARNSLNQIGPESLYEITRYKSPPERVKGFMEALFFLMHGKKYSWDEIKSYMQRSDFIPHVFDFQPTKVPEQIYERLAQEYPLADYSEEKIASASRALGPMAGYFERILASHRENARLKIRQRTIDFQRRKEALDTARQNVTMALQAASDNRSESAAERRRMLEKEIEARQIEDNRRRVEKEIEMRKEEEAERRKMKERELENREKELEMKRIELEALETEALERRRFMAQTLAEKEAKLAAHEEELRRAEAMKRASENRDLKNLNNSDYETHNVTPTQGMGNSNLGMASNVQIIGVGGPAKGMATGSNIQMVGVGGLVQASGNAPIKNPAQGPPQGPPQGFPQGPPQGPPQGFPQGSPQGPPQGFPQGPTKGSPQGPPQGPTQGFPQGPPQGPPKVSPHDPTLTLSQVEGGEKEDSLALLFSGAFKFMGLGHSVSVYGWPSDAGSFILSLSREEGGGSTDLFTQRIDARGGRAEPGRLSRVSPTQLAFSLRDSQPGELVSGVQPHYKPVPVYYQAPQGPVEKENGQPLHPDDPRNDLRDHWTNPQSIKTQNNTSPHAEPPVRPGVAAPLSSAAQPHPTEQAAPVGLVGPPPPGPAVNGFSSGSFVQVSRPISPILNSSNPGMLRPVSPINASIYSVSLGESSGFTPVVRVFADDSGMTRDSGPKLPARSLTPTISRGPSSGFYLPEERKTVYIPSTTFSGQSSGLSPSPRINRVEFSGTGRGDLADELQQISFHPMVKQYLNRVGGKICKISTAGDTKMILVEGPDYNTYVKLDDILNQHI